MRVRSLQLHPSRCNAYLPASPWDECATSKLEEKGDRAPCSYALVDGSGCLLKRTLIQPPREAADVNGADCRTIIQWGYIQDIAPIMENQMDKKIESEMEAGGI